MCWHSRHRNWAWGIELGQFHRRLLCLCALPAPLRNLLLRLALADLFRVRWTDRIHEEWIRSVLAQRPDLLPEQLGRTRDLMDRAVPDCLVTGYEGLIDTLDLPDLDDRHVLAAAIRSQASVIVTYNLRDFPVRGADAPWRRGATSR